MSAICRLHLFSHIYCHFWDVVDHYYAHTRLTALCPGLPGWAGTRKVKPIWILLKQEIVSGSGIWAICKSAPRSRQITTPAPHRTVFYRSDALPAAQPTASKHWRHIITLLHCVLKNSTLPLLLHNWDFCITWVENKPVLIILGTQNFEDIWH